MDCARLITLKFTGLFNESFSNQMLTTFQELFRKQFRWLFFHFLFISKLIREILVWNIVNNKTIIFHFIHSICMSLFSFWLLIWEILIIFSIMIYGFWFTDFLFFLIFLLLFLLYFLYFLAFPCHFFYLIFLDSLFQHFFLLS